MNASGEVHTGEQHRAAESLLFNPHTYDPSDFDDVTRRLLRATIDWFEHRGKEKLLENYRECVWYADFLEFVAKERLFAKIGMQAREANGDRDKRWDTSRISAFSEILAFGFGLSEREHGADICNTDMVLKPGWACTRPQANHARRDRGPQVPV